MLKKPTYLKQTYTGNDQYEGYCIDLLEKIASICNFTYEIKLVDDGFHGTVTSSGRWSGIVGELIDKVLQFNFLIKIKQFK